IQLYFKQDELGADAYELLGLLDLGDLVGVEGPLFKTKTGEISVRVQRLTLLTKSLRPLPLGKEDASGVRHGELSDPELRARQRYADLAVHPEVRELFRLRARVVSYVRAFLDARGYLEVETPVLQPLYGGATAHPFKTHYEALDADFYLRIAVRGPGLRHDRAGNGGRGPGPRERGRAARGAQAQGRPRGRSARRREARGRGVQELCRADAGATDVRARLSRGALAAREAQA